MDIIDKTVLNKIQSVKGYENSVIAGGAVRDHVFGIPARDTDLCIPMFEGRDALVIIDELKKEFKVTGAVSLKGRSGYSKAKGRLQSVYGFTFEGKEFDLIFTNYINDDDDPFADRLVREFNFGLNMAYYDGISTIKTNEFLNDFSARTMTIMNMDDMTQLGSVVHKYMMIYNRYKEHGIDLKFNSSCFEMKKKDAGENVFKDTIKIWNKIDNGIPIGFDANRLRRPLNFDNVFDNF